MPPNYPRSVTTLPLTADELIIFTIRQAALLLIVQEIGLAILAGGFWWLLGQLTIPDGPLIGSWNLSMIMRVGSGIAIGLVALIRLLEYLTTIYTLTTRRVQLDFGILRRSSFAIPLAQIETLDTKRSVFGRLLGYGDVIIRPAAISLPFIIFRSITQTQLRREQIEDHLP